MSSLSVTEQRYIEKVLEMGTGYVLDFTDATFGAFFKRHRVEIHGNKYRTYGTSKAKKMRAFWEQETDGLVAGVLSEMLDNYEAQCQLGEREIDPISLGKGREIVSRLSGRPIEINPTTDDGFLKREFEKPNIQKLPVDLAVSGIIEDRLKEAQLCLSVGAHLSVIFQCGSVLEAVLLGAAQREPQKFNQAPTSPRHNGKVKQFHEWTLSEFINVAHDLRLLKPDVQKFSHGLRDFRNYIHPYQQMSSDFKPDEHTAKLCFQVLKAALADVAGDR